MQSAGGALAVRGSQPQVLGVFLGGGTALEAGAAQVLVLIGLLAAQAVTTASVLRLIATGRVVRGDLRDIYPR